jgi:uncharacterized protein
MDQKIKNLLGVAITIVVFIFAVAAVIYVNAYSKAIEPSSFRSFSVTSEGKAVGVPDIAYFTFEIISQSKSDLAMLQQDNTTRANKAIDFLKSNGIDAKDIGTENYQVTPQYQSYTCSPRPITGDVSSTVCPPPQIVGYTVTQTVSVKIRNFANVGKVLQGVVGAGANSVSQLSFQIDDPANVQNEARTKAIQKAKDKAKSIADAGAFRLGRLLSIQEGNFPMYYGAAAKSSNSIGTDYAIPAPQPTIEPGSQDITVDVTLTYEID